MGYPQDVAMAVVYVLYAVLMIWLGAELAATAGLERTANVLAAFILAGGARQRRWQESSSFMDALTGSTTSSRTLAARAAPTGNIVQPNLYANYLRGSARRRCCSCGRAGRISGASAAFCRRTSHLGERLIRLAGRIALRVRVRRIRRARARAARAAVNCAGSSPRRACLRLRRREPLWRSPGSMAFSIWGPQGRGLSNGFWAHFPTYARKRGVSRCRIFGDAPVLALASGNSPGAAFGTGLTREMAASFQLWTSLRTICCCTCWRKPVPSERSSRSVVYAYGGGRPGAALSPGRSLFLWWIISAVGVEMIHSMLEYPMWRANFLGVTALLMGTLALSPDRGPAGVRRVRVAGLAACAAFTAILTLTLRDYWRLDLARVTGIGRTLAGTSGSASSQDAETLAGWARVRSVRSRNCGCCLVRPGSTATNLDAKLKLSERVVPLPARPIRSSRGGPCVLVLAGRTEEAERLIDRLSMPLPRRSGQSYRCWRLAEGADRATSGSIGCGRNRPVGIGASYQSAGQR